jgi:hypothetical protein
LIHSFRSDTELPVVEPENIEIDEEIFVNNADFDHLMQAEGTNLPLIELQVQNVNPTVDELTVTGYSDKKLNTNPSNCLPEVGCVTQEDNPARINNLDVHLV